MGGAAPVDHGRNHQLTVWVIGRTAPLLAAKKARANVRAFHCHRSVPVFLLGDRKVGENLVRVAVDKPQAAVFGAYNDDLRGFP